VLGSSSVPRQSKLPLLACSAEPERFCGAALFAAHAGAGHAAAHEDIARGPLNGSLHVVHQARFGGAVAIYRQQAAVGHALQLGLVTMGACAQHQGVIHPNLQRGIGHQGERGGQRTDGQGWDAHVSSDVLPVPVRQCRRRRAAHR